jgi:hypothetical protein
VRRWLGGIDAAPIFIEPGSPWQNAYIESFNGKLADELLDIEVFTTLAEARYLADRFRLSTTPPVRTAASETPPRTPSPRGGRHPASLRSASSRPPLTPRTPVSSQRLLPPLEPTDSHSGWTRKAEPVNSREAMIDGEPSTKVGTVLNDYSNDRIGTQPDATARSPDAKESLVEKYCVPLSSSTSSTTPSYAAW